MGLIYAAVDSVADCLVETGYEIVTEIIIVEEEEVEIQVGYAWSRLSDDQGATWTDPVKIGPSDPEQPDVLVLWSGALFCTLTAASEIKSYISTDYGLTWTAI